MEDKSSKRKRKDSNRRKLRYVCALREMNFAPTNARRLHLPNMAVLAKFGLILNRNTDDQKERGYQGNRHPIITLIVRRTRVIAWFSFRKKKRKCQDIPDRRTAHFT